jgi:glycosyltransferase involved in cell wall biosynthesis
MPLNWTGYQYRKWDGYGRYGAYMVRALLKAGVDVTPILEEEMNMPAWMQQLRGTRFDDRLTISCLPPYFLQRSPGKHWLLTMTEGSECPDDWAYMINRSGVERLIVPCQHNADAFASGGVECPITVIPGGTDPDEFPLRTTQRDAKKPYTFLALADRGSRKGWIEAYAAFYKAFGGKTDGAKDVRLIIKCRPEGNSLVDMIAKAKDLDPRLCFQIEDVADPVQVYAQADCFVIPSRSEGWGMPHRECAAMGIPVITQAYSGMDDGHTHEWAIVVEGGHMQPSPPETHIKGEQRRVDVDELAKAMRACYDNPDSAASLGRSSAAWLRQYQTWDHSAALLVQLLQREGALEPERVYA